MCKINIFEILAPILCVWTILLSSAGSTQYVDVNGRPSVRVSQGIMLGTYRTTQANTPYVSFEGIPFAKPPVGDLRFRDPIAADKWAEVLNATQPKALCPQSFFGVIIGSEDCLFVNVYAPVENSSKTLPVMAYIHGGGFQRGSATGAVPEFFIDKRIIVISISYRLGVLGFLCLKTKDVPGNAGMKDQVLALEWIKHNAEYFNGDTGNVCLLGLSAGAASVELHQVSPMSAGLFQKAIAIAGSSLCGWAIQDAPISEASKLGGLLGLNSTSPDFSSRLRALDFSTVALAGSRVQPDVIGSVEDFVFVPVVEKPFCGVEPFLTKQPIEYYHSMDFSQVPTLIGHSSKEYTYFYELNYPIPMAEMLEKPLVVIPKRWQRSLSSVGTLKVYNEIIEFFFKGENITLSDRKIVESAIDLISDVFMAKPVNDAAKIMAKKNKKQVYYYRFSYRGTLNEMGPVGIQGAAHVHELLYLVQLEPERVDIYSSDGYVRRRMVEMFTNFMIYGDPTPGPYSDLLPTVWKPVSPKRMHYMEINGENTPSVNPDEYRMTFWSELEQRVFAGFYDD